MPRASSIVVVAGCLALAADASLNSAAADQADGQAVGAPAVSGAHEAGGESTRWPDSAGSQPYGAVGAIKAAMVCTAVLVLDPQILITAAHCVLDGYDRLTGARPSFTPAHELRREGRSYSGQVWAVGSWRQHVAQSVDDASHDWAIVVLDEAPVGVEPLQVRSYDAGDSANRRWSLVLPAYSSDGTAGQPLRVYVSCSIREVAWEILLHDCEASSGSSGAPLLTRAGDIFEVVGINTGTIALTVDDFGDAAPIRRSAVGPWSFLPALREAQVSLMRRKGVQCIPAC